ncbi:MAG: iron chelate uptake ABC transporter family permease subunit [Bacillota bacterium]|nr:iron chelate uptake ABC transporter family permease subunit [Bacillota bacterium]
MLKDKKSKKVIVLLLLLDLVLIAGFLLPGLTAKNFSFFMPRRMTKILAVIIVSYAIGYSSLTFQTITNNHILTPSVMGLDSLYLFIQTFIVFFAGSKALSQMIGYPHFLISVGFMISAACLLFLLLFRGESKNVYFLVLTGMIMGGLFNGMATFMQVLLDPNEFSVLQGRMFASFNNINSKLIGISIFIILVVFIISIKDLPYLDVVSLGAENAINLGVDYKKLVLKTLIISAVLISVSTALVGPITFLGILIVNLARHVLASYSHRSLTIGTTLLGIFFLTAGLLVTERIFRFETTMSVIINFIGGIYFLYLMLKERKQ